MSSYLSILEGIGSTSDSNDTISNTIDNNDDNNNNNNNIDVNDNNGVEDLGLGYFGVYCISDSTYCIDDSIIKVDTNTATNTEQNTDNNITTNDTCEVPNIDIFDNSNENCICANIVTTDVTSKLKSDSEKASFNLRNGTVIDKISSQSISIADTVLNHVGAHANTLMNVCEKLAIQVHNSMQNNRIVSDVVGCTNESFLFAMDFTHSKSLFIAQSLTADDPETMHWRNLRLCSRENWDSVRLCMASLTWTERQLLEETHEENDEWFEIHDDYLLESINKKGELTDNNDDDSVQTVYFGARWKDLSGQNITKEKVDDVAKVRRQEELEPTLQRWLTLAASEGDEEAQYALTRWFSPPPFAESKSCYVCNRSFTISLFRHHCRYCGHSFCTPHSGFKRRIFRFGMIDPVRVCNNCARIIDTEVWRDSLTWRRLRTEAYLKQTLIPYFGLKVDRRVDKALRIIEGSIKLVKNTLCLNYPAHILIETISILKRYGLSGLAGVLLRQDFMEAVETLKRISGLDKSYPISLHELTACIYYKLAIDRGIRGCNPDGEYLAHQNIDIDDNEKNLDSEINEAIRLAPLALCIAYEENSFECQRLALSQGWTTIYTNSQSDPEQPAYVFLATDLSKSRMKKEGVIAIRGTNSVQDLVTDIRAAPQEFPPTDDEIHKALSGYSSNMDESKYDISSPNIAEENVDDVGKSKKEWEWLQNSSDVTYACGGMARAALWVITQIGYSVLKLHQEGYDIILVGHSLGGSVASLVTYLLMKRIPNIRCVTYGCPTCVDSVTAEELKDRVTSWVLHDDIISRVTPQSIRTLMRELFVFREQVFRHLEQDWSDVISRASVLWTPRWRDHITRRKSTHEQNQNIELEKASRIDTESANVDSSFIIVDEDEIKDLWLPGKIVHIYSHRGQYKAVEITRNFDSIRRIEVQGNIFSDHDAMNIFNALLEVRAVRNSTDLPPQWQPFSIATCQCCHNNFTWHSTFRGDAQEIRERFNCRNCGNLICGPCSTEKRAIPRLGLIFPVRICDTCFYKGEFR